MEAKLCTHGALLGQRRRWSDGPFCGVLVGGGDGSLGVMVPPPSSISDARMLKKMPMLGHANVEGTVTSISIDTASLKGHTLIAYVGTSRSNIYQVAYDLQSMRISAQLVQSAHHNPINAIAFPAEYGEVCSPCRQRVRR